jgi:hypothetical protein
MADFSTIDVAGLFNGPTQIRESIPGRGSAMSDLAVLTTQVMSSVAVPFLAGDIVTSIAFRSGATAAGTPTNWWFALYDNLGNYLMQTADQLTAAWAANTTKPLALLAPQTIRFSGVGYAAVMVKATTPPSLLGQSMFDLTMSTGLVTGQKILAQTSGSGLTTTAPATIASPTATLLRYYAACY